MTNPSKGVKPMEVSKHLPPKMALIEQPAPRWATTTLSLEG